MNSPTIQVTPVILCGGSGTRLWPLSRAGFPKQFLCLTGEESLFQMTAKRLMYLDAFDINVAALNIVSGEEHRFLASEQLREAGFDLGVALLEPIARNSAPALTLAALAALEQGEDPVLVVSPSDQIVTDTVAFKSAIQLAIREANSGAIITLGVKPDRPETGYGYIQTTVHNSADDGCLSKPLQVQSFVEKPNKKTALSYIDQGRHFWNAGIFVLKASIWMSALERFRPDIAQASRVAWSFRSVDVNNSYHFVRPGKAEFAAIPDESVDYAVMEHCPQSDFVVKMVPLIAGWSDLGAWDAVWNVLPKDVKGNAQKGDVISTDSTNTLVHATSRLVSLVGVKNLIVIETADAVLVSDISRSQDVKQIVNQLKDSHREELTQHRKVHRPWGWYACIDEGGRFKVKRIQVKPKASLSLQKHQHRAEHWIVVSGTAEIINGDKVLRLTENESTFIPLGAVHRLTNPGNIVLEIIEVQSGSYLGEDDIVRFEDTFGRANQKNDRNT
jgi:mannose-1-phosphate guanylyltransferase/mannose-6-phosphate isomerase